jgi:cell wall integrity and stress response component
VYAEFQSTGLCGDHCQGSFAFAVVQGHNCWCSNYAPADQQDTVNCNEGCPGISTESCGSESSGLYGYFQLPAGNPLGTSGTGASQASSTSFSSVSTFRSSSFIPLTRVLFSSTSIPSPRPWSSPLVTVVPVQSPTSSSSSVYLASSSTEDVGLTSLCI